MATKKTVKKGASPRAKSAPAKMPQRIFAQASPHSLGGVSMFDVGDRINVDTYQNFYSEEKLLMKAAQLLSEAGFEVLQITGTTINIAGSQKTYEEAFNTKLVLEQRTVIKPVVGETLAEFVECPATDLPGLIATRGTKFADLLEGVALEEPIYFMELPFAPLKSYWHLRVPGDVSLGCNADRAHRSGITGKGVKVAMVDSGHFMHKFFTERGYRVAPVVLGPGTANPLADDNGHGTAESANVFAVAPDAELLPVKINFANSKGAFDAAVGLNPDIITCSWGSSIASGPLSAANAALATSVAAAVAAGITVVFSAGNGHLGFPGQHPDVISAGGVYIQPNGTLRASDYASGFPSGVYPGRKCPDLCGLVGMKPRAAYIMLPLQPNCSIDVDLAGGGAHPNGDETANNDGWAAISGTSAAAPQLAGVAALMKQACAKLKPAEIRQIMINSARDVTVGNCNTASGGFAAGPGWDQATGTGLVDAHKAVLMAKVKCLTVAPGVVGPGVVGPPTPITTTGPVPITPITTGPTPVTPITGPIRPITTGPLTPLPPQPITAPVVNPNPIGQASEAAPAAAAPQGLTEEDVQSLQEMIMKSELKMD